MDILNIYHESIPAWILPALEAPEMVRLQGVGMNCGCDYTQFHAYRPVIPYSRWDHSIGVALIVWHFTGDKQQTLSALFHDIASPVFAHVVDFLKGDHMTQESTEDGTCEIIRDSEIIQQVLCELDLTTEDVRDYHRFPIADNNAPQLAADRLEYSCGNMVNYGYASVSQVRELFDDLIIGINEHGIEELMFRTPDTASRFSRLTLQCSRVYVSDEDRFAMQALADLLKDALKDGLLAWSDLYTTESEVIRKLETSEKYRARWAHFCSYGSVIRSDKPGQDGDWKKVPSKKRVIDPYVCNLGRVTSLDPDYASDLRSFLDESMDYWICGF